MTNITPPRDPETADFALRLYLMNQPGWPHKKPGVGTNKLVVWPTLKSYQWMRQFGGNQHAGNHGQGTKKPPRDRA